MNAVQRRYPQIYKSSDRLVIEPKNINVVARDFTIAQKRRCHEHTFSFMKRVYRYCLRLSDLIPSTSRSSTSAASALPSQLMPLLNDWLQSAQGTLAKILPEIKKPNVLEEAEYEEDADGGFEKEKMIQCMSHQFC